MGCNISVAQQENIIRKKNYNQFIFHIKHQFNENTENFNKFTWVANIMTNLIIYKSHWINTFVKDVCTMYNISQQSTKILTPIKYRFVTTVLESLTLADKNVVISFMNSIEYHTAWNGIYITFAKMYPDYVLEFDIIFTNHIPIVCGLLIAKRYDVIDVIFLRLNKKEIYKISHHKIILRHFLHDCDLFGYAHLEKYTRINYADYAFQFNEKVTMLDHDEKLKNHNLGINFFAGLCVMYKDVVNSCNILPTVLSKEITEYADFFSDILHDVEHNCNDMETFYEIALNNGCVNYDYIARHSVDKYPKIIQKLLPHLQIPYPFACDNKHFVVTHFDIETSIAETSKKRKNTLSDTAASLHDKLVDIKESTVNNCSYAFDDTTLSNITNHFLKKTTVPQTRYCLLVKINQILNNESKNASTKLSMYPVSLLCSGIITRRNVKYLSNSDKRKFLASYGYDTCFDINNAIFLRLYWDELLKEKHITNDMFDISDISKIII